MVRVRPVLRPRARLLALVAWLTAQTLCSTEPAAPYTVAPGLFQPDKPDLGLAAPAGARTVTVFRPTTGPAQFNNGAVLIEFQGRFYAQWQSSAHDEDSPDTWVAYSTSDDGETWSPPRVLAAAGSGGAMHSSGGWWTDGRTLVAYINVWPHGFQSGHGGHTEFMLSTDGATWTTPRRLTDAAAQPLAGIIEQDPHRYDGRLHTAFHVPPGLTAQPFHTDDPLGLTGWTRGTMTNLPFTEKNSRELEPSIYRRADHALVMVFRDQASTFHQLASVSRDRGATWSTPVTTDMPDARAKQSAGNLPDGSAYLVNAPNSARERRPLAVTLSRDGQFFERSFLLRGSADLPPLRFAGRYKRAGYHYPKSLVARGCLFVIYATNKEDIELTRVPLASLAPTPATPP